MAEEQQTAMENCGHDCANCQEECASRDPNSFLAAPNPRSRVGRLIGVLSGKGGVGKSMVTELLAVRLSREGRKTGILDADITGPSIPQAFGVKGPILQNQDGLIPPQSKGGVSLMSINLLLEHTTDPVAWRGPIISGTVKQFWSDVDWGTLDVLLVDMPPGTGDVALTVFQSLPLDGAIIVTTPQDLVSMIVSKAVNLEKMMPRKVPILGVIENMSYLTCPHCREKINLFGRSHLEEFAAANGLPVLGRIPLDPALTQAVDEGRVEEVEAPWLDEAVQKILA